MKVVVTKERSDDFMYEGLEIALDDTYKFGIGSSEDSPEDNNMSRNFSDCHDIPNMLRKAYEAGKNGESFDLLYTEETLD